MKRFIIFIFSIGQSILSTAQTSPLNLSFIRGIGGVSDEQVVDVALDHNGDIVVVGTFKNTVNFNPTGSASLTSYMQSASSYSADVFIAKYSAGGIFQWVNTFGGNSASGDNVAGVEIDNANNIYVLGSFYDSVDYSIAPGWQTMVAQPGLADLLFAKYSSNGNLIWAKQLGGTSSDAATDIAIDNNNNIYLTGTFFGTADYDPGPGFDTLTYITAGPCSFQTPCTPDIFIAKYDTAGNHIWARQAGGINNDNPKNLVCDTHGNIFLSGTFVFNITFGIGGPVTDTLTSIGTNDAFVAKYLPNGNLAWVKQLGGTNSMVINDLKFDHHGNFVITGGFQGDTDFDWGADTTNLFSTPGTNNIYFAKYDSAANFVFAKNMEHLNAPGQDFGNSVAFDAVDNIYLTGVFYGQNCDFDPAPTASVLLSSANSNNNELFLGKYTSTGEYIWADRVGDSGGEEGKALAIDAQSSVIIGATTSSGSSDFDFSSSTSTYSTAGSNDGVVVKYTQCIINTGINSTAGVLTAQGVSGTYQWINCGVGNAPISGATSQTFTPLNSGTYACIITNSATCKDTTACLFVDVCANFSAGITQGTNASVTCTVANASSYQWLECNANGINYTLIPNATSQTFTPTVNGSYACKVVKNGCVDTTVCVTINDVGMPDLQAFQVKVFPNPANENLQIQSSEGMQLVRIMEVTGKELICFLLSQKNSETISIANLAAGIYVMQIQGKNNHVVTYTFVKE